MSTRWQLWVTDDGRVRWFDPTNRWGTKPGAPWVLQGEYRVEPEKGLVDPPPKGMLRADPARQVYGLGGPHYVYADQQRTCRECRSAFVFRAEEQRRWYEELRFWNEVDAHRCVDCRRAWRARREAQKRLMSAHEATKSGGADAHLELAEATLAAEAELGLEALRRAIGHARKAEREPALEPRARSVVQALEAVLEARGNRSRLP